MPDPNTAYTKARHHELRAYVRGDFDAAERWTKVMRDHLGCARKLMDLYNPRPIPKPKPPKQAPPPPCPSCSAPRASLRAVSPTGISTSYGVGGQG